MKIEVKNEVVRKALEALRSDRKKDSVERIENPLRQAPDPAGHDLLDDDPYQPFIGWFDQSIWLDSGAVARRDPNPTWSTTVTALYGDFCVWLAQHDQAPASRNQFLALLRELGCDIRLIAGQEFVLNIALREDRLAVDQFGPASAETGAEQLFANALVDADPELDKKLLTDVEV